MNGISNNGVNQEVKEGIAKKTRAQYRREAKADRKGSKKSKLKVVTAPMSDEEIKKAYRALAIMYHPDKVSSLGDEAIRQATESMKQINQAWNIVKEARGMK